MASNQWWGWRDDARCGRLRPRQGAGDSDPRFTDVSESALCVPVDAPGQEIAIMNAISSLFESTNGMM